MMRTVRGSHRSSSKPERKWCVLARALLLASDVLLCQAVPGQGWIGWQIHYPSVTAEWIGRGWNAGGEALGNHSGAGWRC